MGFPNPAKDFMQPQLDFHRDVLLNPDNTFYLRVQSDSLATESICTGDLLVIDRVQQPKRGQLVYCLVDGEASVIRLSATHSSEIHVLGTVVFIMRKAYNEHAGKLPFQIQLYCGAARKL